MQKLRRRLTFFFCRDHNHKTKSRNTAASPSRATCFYKPGDILRRSDTGEAIQRKMYTAEHALLPIYPQLNTPTEYPKLDAPTVLSQLYAPTAHPQLSTSTAAEPASSG